MPRLFIMSLCVAGMNLVAMVSSYSDTYVALGFLVMFNLWIMFSIYLVDKDCRWRNEDLY